MLPSEKSAKKLEEQRRIEVERKEQEQHLRIILNGCFAAPDGIQVLRWLMTQCQWGKPLQILDERSLMVSAMRQNLYCEIRRHLTPEILSKVENG